MKVETKSMHITPIGGNVFADLGFEPTEAARMLAETDKIVLTRRESERLHELTENSPGSDDK